VSERPSAAELLAVVADVLRPLVAELVAEELARAHDAPRAEEEPPYLTVAQYAERHRASPAAVRARIRRGALPEAFIPPGGREYLIPNERADGNGAGERAQLPPTTKSPGDAATSRGATPKG
jgi:hypothetical protein